MCSLRLLLIAGIDATWSAIGVSLWHLPKTPIDLAPEMTVALEEWLKRIPDFRLDPQARSPGRRAPRAGERPSEVELASATPAPRNLPRAEWESSLIGLIEVKLSCSASHR
jgi:hypothetical protein